MQRCHPYKIALKIFFFFFFFFFWGGGGGRGGGGLGVQGVCERRIEVFVKIQKKKLGGGGRWGGSGSGWGRVGGSDLM